MGYIRGLCQMHMSGLSVVPTVDTGKLGEISGAYSVIPVLVNMADWETSDRKSSCSLFP